MWNPSAHLKRPAPNRIIPPYGWMMDARQAAIQLRRMGLLSRKDVKTLNQWIREGCPPSEGGSRLDWITWAVWMWQMAPGNFTEH